MCAPWNEAIGDRRSSSALARRADWNIRPVATVTTAPASRTRSSVRRVRSDSGYSGLRIVPSMSSAIIVYGISEPNHERASHPESINR